MNAMVARRQLLMTSTNRWIRLIAVLCLVIAGAAFISLMRSPAHAETPAFPAGKRPFTNPFANPGSPTAPGNDPFFEGDEEDDEFSDEAFNSAAASAAAGGGAPGGTTALTSGSSPGVSMGGTTPGGVISKSDVAFVKIDDEGGTISKEIVTDFNFPDADILDIAKALGRLTGKNFILDKDVKGRITIISNSPITVADAWKAFLTALDINGFALIPSGKYIRIARQRDARDKQLKTFAGDYAPDSDALITRIFPLKYINAEEVARTFRSFMPANSRIIPYNQTNTVIVTDTGSNITKLSKMLDILDVEGFDAGIEVIPVRYASAVELAKLIDQLIPGTGSTPGAPAPGGAPRFAGGSRFSARKTKEGGIINTVISDERTNNLIVHANTRGADQVRELVAKLDQRLPSQSGGGRVHVIYLQFADAEQVANTLNNISTAAPSRAAPAGGGGGTGTNPVNQALFEGNIKISPDKSTNSLVVTASASDYSTIQRVVNKLDIPRDEVYVEAIIMEISTDRRFEYSANVVNPSSGVFSIPSNKDLVEFVTNPVSSQGAIISFANGGSRTFTVGSNSVTVPNLLGLIKAIQSNTNSNVLATPQIIALDNTEATFESGENLPLPQTSLAGTGISQLSVTREKVALSMKIKPQINKLSNFVKLDIETKLQDISNRQVPAQLKDLAFATIERSAKTQVVVADGDTIVIGGLMRNKINDSVNKIPLLGDIPLLGWLFRSKTQESVKSNLLIFMTPTIIRQYEKVRALLDGKLKERDDFIEAHAGGQDPLRSKRNDIIRSLPDLSKIDQEKVVPRTRMNDIDLDDAINTPNDPNDPNNPRARPQAATPVPSTPDPAAPQGYVPPQGALPQAPPQVYMPQPYDPNQGVGIPPTFDPVTGAPPFDPNSNPYSPPSADPFPPGNPPESF